MPISKEEKERKRRNSTPWLTELYGMNCDEYKKWVNVDHHVLTQQTLQDVIEIIENPDTPVDKFSRSRSTWNRLDPWIRHLIYEYKALLMDPTCTQLKFNYDKLTYVLFRKPNSMKGDWLITTHIVWLAYGTQFPTPKHNLLLPHK